MQEMKNLHRCRNVAVFNVFAEYDCAELSSGNTNSVEPTKIQELNKCKIIFKATKSMWHISIFFI